MNEKAVYLALAGFMPMVMLEDVRSGVRIKRGRVGGEPQVSTRSGRWKLEASGLLASYDPIPWDDVSDQVLSSLEWDMIYALVEREYA